LRERDTEKITYDRFVRGEVLWGTDNAIEKKNIRLFLEIPTKKNYDFFEEGYFNGGFNNFGNKVLPQKNNLGMNFTYDYKTQPDIMNVPSNLPLVFSPLGSVHLAGQANYIFGQYENYDDKKSDVDIMEGWCSANYKTAKPFELGFYAEISRLNLYDEQGYNEFGEAITHDDNITWVDLKPEIKAYIYDTGRVNLILDGIFHHSSNHGHSEYTYTDTSNYLIPAFVAIYKLGPNTLINFKLSRDYDLKEDNSDRGANVYLGVNLGY
jgi:hypothetical protein